MSWPHQMWNPSGTYVHLPAADSVVTNLTEPEAPGQINVLSQDCFASPGAAITGLNGAGLGVAGTEDLVVSTIVVNPIGGVQYEYSAVTPNVTVGQTSGSLTSAIYLDRQGQGSPDSQYIGFARANYDRVDKGILSVGAVTGPGNDAAFTIFNWSTVVSTGAPFKTGPLFPSNISTTIIDTLSSINNVSWASISTAAATV